MLEKMMRLILPRLIKNVCINCTIASYLGSVYYLSAGGGEWEGWVKKLGTNL